jgi:ketosteroid isomerase-like protein
MDETMETLRAYSEAWRRGDMKALTALYADDFTLHYPGTHSLAGIHSGKAAALAVLREVSARTQRKLVEVLDVMSGSHRGAIQVIERWHRGEREALVDRVFVYEVSNRQLPCLLVVRCRSSNRGRISRALD